jgi:acetone monooxygenase
MTETSVVEKTTNDAATRLKLDAAVIGAGVAGLYQLHLLRQHR